MNQDEDWVAEVTGGTVTRFEQTTAGRSRQTWLVDVERASQDSLELVLRRDTGDGPLSGTELSLKRESLVYHALQETPVLLPRLHGVAPDGQALLVERVRGGEELGTASDDSEREGIIEGFIDELACLHSVDVDALELDGFARPATPEEHATLDIELWERVLNERSTRPAPLFRFALRWLTENAPTSVQRTVMCHGDAGPGNFLFHDGAVTALLDWEFAHIGDPMDDLAWFTLRSHDLREDCGDLSRQLRRYADATGIEVDPDAIQYYRVLVLTRMGIACLSGLDNRSGSMDASTYFMLLPALQKLLVTVLAERLDLALEPTPLCEATPVTPRSEVLESVAADLESVILPELSSEAALTRSMGMLLLLSHLQVAETLARPLEGDEMDDLSSLLGSRPRSLRDGLFTVQKSIIDNGASTDEEELLRFFARQADRQVALWPVLAAIAGKTLSPVEVA